MYIVKYTKVINSDMYYAMHPHLDRNVPIRHSSVIIHCENRERAEVLCARIQASSPVYVSYEDIEIIHVPPIVMQRRGAVVLSMPPLNTQRQPEPEEEKKGIDPITPDSPDFSNRVRP